LFIEPPECGAVELRIAVRCARAGNGSAIELMDVNDPKFAPRIFADPKIEDRVAAGSAGTVRNGPIEWLIHDKQIRIARPHQSKGNRFLLMSRRSNFRRPEM
jgi:hypothetical protein